MLFLVSRSPADDQESPEEKALVEEHARGVGRMRIAREEAAATDRASEREDTSS